MPAIYQADVWCDSCADEIRDRIADEGFAPEDPDDECSYDSDEYPKYMGDNEESDTPMHCVAGEECLECWTLPSGRKIGAPLGDLTSEGRAYVIDTAREELNRKGEVGEVAALWCQLYDIDLPEPPKCNFCGELLNGDGECEACAEELETVEMTGDDFDFLLGL